MPSGEVFTGPHEDVRRGAHPLRRSRRRPRGVEVAGIELEFREGVVVSARADRGDEVLQAMLATDDGARRLGELGIGTNFGVDRAIGSILVDEKMGGTVHLALGRSYPETGGTNESAIHWDMICDLREAAGSPRTASRSSWTVRSRRDRARRREHARAGQHECGLEHQADDA